MPLIQAIVPRVMNLKAQLRDPAKVLFQQGCNSFISGTINVCGNLPF